MMKKIMMCAGVALLSGCSSMHTHDDVYAHSDSDVKPVYIEARHQHIVTFEYDSATLPFNAAEIVEPHVRHLLEHPDVTVALQGNASSEGGAAYNYALGIKRAEAVKSVMTELGLDASRVAVLSVGESRSGYSPNRSVIISY